MNPRSKAHHKKPKALVTSSPPDLEDLKKLLPLPDLMKHLGLGNSAKPSCKSPFRSEQNASWGIFEKGGNWYFKDHGTGESGDEIDFLALHLSLDHRKHFPQLLGIYQALAETYKESAQAPADVQSSPTKTKVELPDKKGLGLGSDDQLLKLAKLRAFSIESLKWAQEKGFLVFGDWMGHEVYGVTDSSGRVLEIRRLDGLDFSAYGSSPAHKSHSIKGSSKSWALGLNEAKDSPVIALVEGLPDFLAAHHLVLKEQGPNSLCAVVAMLSGNVGIAKEVLPDFKDKSVVIYAHADDAGLKGALKWKAQLEGQGVKAQIFDISAVAKKWGPAIKDLNDVIKIQGFDKIPELQTIMPQVSK